MFKKWKTMDSAPRDGTIIEIKHLSGWQDIYQYKISIYGDGPRWCKYDNNSFGIFEEENFRWRSFNKNPLNYNKPCYIYRLIAFFINL